MQRPGRETGVELSSDIIKRRMFWVCVGGPDDRPRLSNGVFTPEQDNDKTNVEPVHSYYAFHTRSDKPGVKGIIGRLKDGLYIHIINGNS